MYLVYVLWYHSIFPIRPLGSSHLMTCSGDKVWLRVISRFFSSMHPMKFIFMADSRFALSQWETALLCNDVSHWLRVSLESALILKGVQSCAIGILLMQAQYIPQNMLAVLWCFVLELLYHYTMTSSKGNIFRVTGLYVGNSPVTGEFPAQRPVTRSFDVFFDLHLE